MEEVQLNRTGVYLIYLNQGYKFTGNKITVKITGIISNLYLPLVFPTYSDPQSS